MPRPQTVMFFLEGDGQPPDLKLGSIFLQGFLVTACGIGAAFLLFRAEASLISVFLTALGQARTAHALLDRNREEIWGGDCVPREANLRLTAALTTMFAGVFLAFALAALVMPVETAAGVFVRQIGGFGGQSITQVVFDDFGTVLPHNLVVLLVGFLFAFLYRHGGMVLVLAWNASVWGVVFPWIARNAPDNVAGGTVAYFLKSLVAILPHLVLEGVGYILAAMAGIFVSKVVTRYEFGSPQFRQAGGAVVLLVGLAVATIVVASLAEAFVAPGLIRVLF